MTEYRSAVPVSSLVKPSHQVRNEIAGLKNILVKPTLRGDENRIAIAAQISVLEQLLESDHAVMRWGLTGFVTRRAQEAFVWFVGWSDESLVDSWFITYCTFD